MTVQEYMITEYSMNSYKNIFLSYIKHSENKGATVLYIVDRKKKTWENFEKIGYTFKSLNDVENAIRHHAFSVMKKTSDVNIYILVEGKGVQPYKTIP